MYEHIKRKRRFRALSIDLDGTILRPDNSISERTISAIKACAKQGLKIIICTGRSPDASEAYRSALGAEGPMVYFNGAEVTDMPRGKPFYPALLGLDVIDFCVDISRQTGIYFQVYFPETDKRPTKLLLTERDGHEREMYLKHTGLEAVIGDIKEAITVPTAHKGGIKGMFLADAARFEAIRLPLIEKFGDSIYVAQTLKTFLEVMSADISKGKGLKIALDQLGIRSDETIAFGDEENDLPMFDVAGFSVAPSNAKANVRAAADLVIGSNAEDGVAAFLEEQVIIGNR
jgi:Cof subfamily protein (haloacid dehalogenase superfamily)